MSAAGAGARGDRGSIAPELAPPAGPLLARRLTAQLLSGRPARDPVAVAERLLAIQGQDPRAARLAIRARSRCASAAVVDRALTDERTLLITWCNRGTLHLVRREDYPLLHVLTTPRLRTANTTRLRQTGVSEAALDRGLRVVKRSLSDDGPLSRAILTERLRAAGVPVADQAFVHIMFRAGLDGLAIRGPMIGRQHAYALVRDWLPEAPAAIAALERPRALGELARRYLLGHAPAGDRDLARWAGITLGDARRGLDRIAGQLRERRDGLLELEAGPRQAAAVPPPRLLGPFEELLLGWDSRELVLGAHAGRVIAGGMFRGIALAHGRAVAAWQIRDRRVVLDPFTTLDGELKRALRADGAAVLAFLGLG